MTTHLTDAYARGILDINEFDLRNGLALTSTDLSEIEALVKDLPAQKMRLSRRGIAVLSILIVLILVCLVMVLLTTV